MKTYLFVVIAGLVLGAFFITSVDAFAYTQGAQPPDPGADPGGFAALVANLWRSGAMIPAGILAAYGVAVLLRKTFGWFRTGKQAAVFTAVITAAGAVVEAAARGVTPNAGMLMAAAASAFLLWVKLDNGDPPVEE